MSAIQTRWGWRCQRNRDKEAAFGGTQETTTSDQSPNAGEHSWLGKLAEKTEHPLFEFYFSGALFGIFAAASWERLIQYGTVDRPYLYLAVGNWTWFVAGIWSIGSPLWFTLINRSNPKALRIRIVAVLIGLGWGFTFLRFMAYWFPNIIWLFTYVWNGGD